MKIALIGSQPSSVQLAPYNDPSWQVFACSPGAIPHVKRADLWFEMHAMNDINRPCCDPAYIRGINNLNCPVMMLERDHRLPRSEPFPIAEMMREFGAYCWGSSLSYMIAMAIYQAAQSSDEEKIVGLWGVDMSATEEYAIQKPTLHMLIDKAQDRGVEVTTPMESDLLRPTPMYGYREIDPAYVKWLTRVKEINARLADAEQRFDHSKTEIHFLKGALDDIHYNLRTWVYDRTQIDYALNPALRRITHDQTAKIAKAIDLPKNTEAAPYVDPYLPRYENGADVTAEG